MLMLLPFATMRDAFLEVDRDENSLRNHAVLAMGVLAGHGWPGCHAAIVRLYQRAFPDAPLPDLVDQLLRDVDREPLQ